MRNQPKFPVLLAHACIIFILFELSIVNVDQCLSQISRHRSVRQAGVGTGGARGECPDAIKILTSCLNRLLNTVCYTT